MTMLNEKSRQLTRSGPLHKVRSWLNAPPQHKSNILLMVSKNLGLWQVFIMIYTTIWSILRIWNIRVSGWWLHWNTVRRQLPKYKLQSADNYAFLYEKVNEYHTITACFVHEIMQSAFMRIQFAHNSMSYFVLRASWCDIKILNMHSSAERKPVAVLFWT